MQDRTIIQQLEVVRNTGQTNMFDTAGVRQVAEALDLDELLNWLNENKLGTGRGRGDFAEYFRLLQQVGSNE